MRPTGGLHCDDVSDAANLMPLLLLLLPPSGIGSVSSLAVARARALHDVLSIVFFHCHGVQSDGY